MTKQEFISWVVSLGYEPDKYGHYQKTIGDKQYRYKLQAQSIRKEVRVRYDSGGSNWVRIFSGYLSRLTINDKNQLTPKGK